MKANLYPAAATLTQSIGAPPGWLNEDTSTPSASPAGAAVRAAAAPARPASIRSTAGECVALTLRCQATDAVVGRGVGSRALAPCAQATPYTAAATATLATPARLARHIAEHRATSPGRRVRAHQPGIRFGAFDNDVEGPICHWGPVSSCLPPGR